MSAIEKLASILIEQNRLAKESWTMIQELNSTIISAIVSYLQNLIAYFPGEIDFLEKIGIQASNEKERMKDIKENFEKNKETLTQVENVALLSKFVQNLLEAEYLRHDLYQASLKILELKKRDPIIKEYFGTIHVETQLKPGEEIISGRLVKAHVKLTNFSTLIQKLKLYVAWYHPLSVLSKCEEENIELTPLSTLRRVYAYRPRAKGKHSVRVTIFKEKNEIASTSKDFEVIAFTSFNTLYI